MREVGEAAQRLGGEVGYLGIHVVLVEERCVVQSYGRRVGHHLRVVAVVRIS